jgi:type II secretory pathway pseudopilin PulG
MKHMMRRGGYILFDLITGLVLAGIILVALTVAVVSQNHLAARLAESRNATAAVEGLLAQLQRGGGGGGPPLAVSDDVRMAVRPIDDRPLGSHVWVEVSAERDGRSVSLIGLIPRQSLVQWQQNVPASQPARGDVEGGRR